MKFASTILSIILFILSCMPCADAESDNLGTEQTKIVTENQSGDKREKHNDLCSPFCVCNCCGTQILSVTPILVFNAPPIQINFISRLDILYKSHLASTFSGSIWQPPQIA